jgi:hypothetical protein
MFFALQRGHRQNVLSPSSSSSHLLGGPVFLSARLRFGSISNNTSEQLRHTIGNTSPPPVDILMPFPPSMQSSSMVIEKEAGLIEKAPKVVARSEVAA